MYLFHRSICCLLCFLLFRSLSYLLSDSSNAQVFNERGLRIYLNPMIPLVRNFIVESMKPLHTRKRWSTPLVRKKKQKLFSLSGLMMLIQEPRNRQNEIEKGAVAGHTTADDMAWRLGELQEEDCQNLNLYSAMATEKLGIKHGFKITLVAKGSIAYMEKYPNPPPYRSVDWSLSYLHFLYFQ